MFLVSCQNTNLIENHKSIICIGLKSDCNNIGPFNFCPINSYEVNRNWWYCLRMKYSDILIYSNIPNIYIQIFRFDIDYVNLSYLDGSNLRSFKKFWRYPNIIILYVQYTMNKIRLSQILKFHFTLLNFVTVTRLLQLAKDGMSLILKI